MKTFTFLILLGFGLCFSFEAKSQAVTISDNAMTFTDGLGRTYTSIRSRTIELPLGYVITSYSIHYTKLYDCQR